MEGRKEMKYTVRKEEGILNSKVGKFLQLLIIVFLSVLAMLAFKPLQSTIYASSYNGNQSETTDGSGSSWGNTQWDYSQVGYRVYLYNVNTGSVISDVKDIVGTTPHGNKAYSSTRKGGGNVSGVIVGYPDYGHGAMPSPFNGSTLHGSALRAWFTGNNNANGNKFIWKVFHKKYTSLPEGTYLIMEDLMWRTVPNTTDRSGNSTSDVFYGTYNNLCNDYYPHSSYINPEMSGGYAYYKNDNYWRSWHTWLPNALVLDNAEDAAKLGLTVPADAKARMFSTLGNQGLGMHAFHVAGSDSITHTWDKKNCPKTPGKAPDDTSLYPAHDSDDPNYNCHIVKLYYDLKDDGKTPDETKPRVKDKNCFYRDLTCTKIEVEDEEEVGYRVMDWSTSYSSGNEWENVTHWSEVPTPIQKATKKTLLSIHTHTNASLSSRALFFCLFLEVCRTAYFSIEHLAVCAVYPFPQHHGFPSS